MLPLGWMKRNGKSGLDARGTERGWSEHAADQYQFQLASTFCLQSCNLFAALMFVAVACCCAEQHSGLCSWDHMGLNLRQYVKHPSAVTKITVLA